MTSLQLLTFLHGPVNGSIAAEILFFQDVIPGSPEWIPASIALFILGLIFVLWNVLSAGRITAVQVIGALLKVMAIALIACCLIEPMRRGERARPQENILPILVDVSQSMQLKPPGEAEGRLERLEPTLRQGASWSARMEQDFDVRRYTFGRRLEGVDQFDQLDAQATSSSLINAVKTLDNRLNRRPVAGVLLFTDGNATDSFSSDGGKLGVGELDQVWSDIKFPVYPVIQDKEAAFKDLRLDEISIQQTDFESSPTTILVRYAAEQLADKDAFLQLIDLMTGQVIEEQKVTIDSDQHQGEVSFRFRPEAMGVSFYEVLAFSEDDRDTFMNPTTEGMLASEEATLLNNAEIVSVHRSRGPYRILYVAGRPNWEYKFLRRSLQADAEVQMVGLIRIANKEPKFSFRDRSVTSTNPLFAGLGTDQEDAAEQYDEPVMIRLGVKESEELSNGFPKSQEELFAYHAIILDDLESDFFTQDQMLLIRKFVGSRGGGILMLGGQESFASKAMRETPLGELAPIYASQEKGVKPAGSLRIGLTREGMLQPWLRSSDTEVEEQTRLRAENLYKTINAAGDLKPGASLLAYAESVDGQQYPALVSQRFGRGRSASWLLGDLWRPAMHRESTDDDTTGQRWRQITHWLVNDVPRRVEVRVEQSDDPNESVQLIATVRDEAYLPLDNAKVTFEITPVGGDAFQMEGEMDDDRPGVYQSQYWSDGGTAFHVSAKAMSMDGEVIGESETGWTQSPGASEFRQLDVDRNRLEQIAAKTGGRVITTSELDRFAQALPNQKVPVTESWLYPLWHSPFVMILAMACLCLDWGLRRWKGMA